MGLELETRGVWCEEGADTRCRTVRPGWDQMGWLGRRRVAKQRATAWLLHVGGSFLHSLGSGMPFRQSGEQGGGGWLRWLLTTCLRH